MPPSPTPDPEKDQVRRLLAEARHDEPLPSDVADRLDAALADLAGTPLDAPEPPADRSPGEPVVDLLAARRRRTARNLIAAAAAVVVVGVGLGQLDLTSGGEDSTSSADSAGSATHSQRDESGASDRAPRRDADVPELAAEEAKPVSPDSIGLGALSTKAARNMVVRLDPERFSRQVQRLSTHSQAAYDSSDAPAGSADATARCDDEAWGAGIRLRARYAGSPGVLVFRPVQGHAQVVDLYLCGSLDPIRSTTLAGR